MSAHQEILLSVDSAALRVRSSADEDLHTRLSTEPRFGARRRLPFPRSIEQGRELVGGLFLPAGYAAAGDGAGARDAGWA